MTLKETIADELQSLLDELEEDDGEMTAEEVKALVKEKAQSIIDLVTDE